MGLTNFGNQTISFKYKEPGKSENFNKINYKLLPTGIYEGGLLTYYDSNTVQLNTFSVFLEDSTTDVSVRISTEVIVSIDVALTTPYIILRYEWLNAENNYLDVLAVDYSSILADDIIVGRCNYDSSNVLLSTFDYTRRTVSSLQNLDDKKENLKVLPTEPITNTVEVNAGELLIFNKPFSFANNTSSIISDTVDGRIDLVFIDNNGLLQILEGIDSVTPVEPAFPSNGTTLAKITRGALETVVRGDQISLYDFDIIAGSGSGSSIEATTGEAVNAGDLVYFASDGKLYLADNRYFEKSIVAGFALVSAGIGILITVGKLGLIDEFSGLVTGVEKYLGYSGAMINSGAIDYSEYKVHVGTVVNSTTVDAFVQLPAMKAGQDDSVPISAITSFAKYKDRSAQGYIAFDYDNAISQANYPILYSEIGDIYEQAHLDAGDSASGVGMFYPTPPPSSYNRAGIPDSSSIDSTSAIDLTSNEITVSSNFYHGLNVFKANAGDRGTPVKIKLLSGSLPVSTPQIDTDTIYYTRLTNGTLFEIMLYITEADAIAATNVIDITATATGTFRLTQEGIALYDAFQGHWLRVGENTAAGTTVIDITGNSNSGDVATTGTSNYGTNLIANVITENTLDGTPRTINETRGKTTILFYYIKAENVLTSGEPLSALRYDSGWIANSTWSSSNFTIVHGLNADFSKLNIHFFISTDGTESNAFELLDTTRVYDAATAADLDIRRGVTKHAVDTNTIKISTGTDGISYFDGTNVLLGLTTNAFYYKVVITKPNLITTTFDVSGMPKVVDLTSADYTYTLPAITGAPQRKTIKAKNGGTFKLTMAANGADTIDNLTPSTWQIEGEGILVVESDGTSDWIVVEYEDSGTTADSGTDTNRSWRKLKDKTLICVGKGSLIFSASASGSLTVVFAKAMLNTDYFPLAGNRFSVNPPCFLFNITSMTTTGMIFTYFTYDASAATSTTTAVPYTITGTWA